MQSAFKADQVQVVGRFSGGHLVRNASEGPVRILMLSTNIVPEIVEYPDSGKVYALSAKGELIFHTRYGEPVEYWDGEP